MAADQMVAGGGELRPLHGVPFTVKENIDVFGTPTTQGLNALAHAFPERDAPVAVLAVDPTASVIAKYHARIPELMAEQGIRHPRFTVDEIAEFSTALDSAAVVTTLHALGWNMDRWEQWVADFLALFLDPSSVYRSTT